MDVIPIRRIVVGVRRLPSAGGTPTGSRCGPDRGKRSYTDITRDAPHDFEFDIEICVPAGTGDGVYEFGVCAMGEGVEFARQQVTITVVSAIEVPVDIKPTSCPNPLQVDLHGNGILPVAILGTASFDALNVDPSTVRLEGVAPTRSAIEDVATPFYPFTGKEDCLDCTTEGRDGYTDLTLKFSRREILQALGLGRDGALSTDDDGGLLRDVPPTFECRVLHLTGELYDGTVIVGEDVVRIQHGQ